MPMRPPSIRACGCVVRSGERCQHMVARDRERKARFDAQRPSARERGYTSKWDRERAAYLKAHPRCCRCGAPSTVVNHKTPHKGDKRLFWSRSNWEPVCAPCHNGPIQSQERRS
jgi:5-methylcytosine-specific restriction enzyme A